MRAEKQVEVNRNWAILIGAGLALTPIHNHWLTDLVTKGGEVGFFVPAFGIAIWFMASLLFVIFNWHSLDWGDRKVYIPLLVIVGAIGMSGVSADTWIGKFVPVLMGVALFSVYLVARELGQEMFLPLAIGAGIASFGVIISSLLHPGRVTGGIVFEQNYDIVVGYVLLGVALFIKKAQWVLASLALVAIFATGSPEGVFVLGVMAGVVLLRRDWGKKLIMAIIPVILIATLWFGLGYGQELYRYTTRVAKVTPTMDAPTLPLPSDQAPQITESEGQGDIKMSTIGYRWEVIKHFMANIEPLGSGYNLTDFSKHLNVHNVPLVIVQQLGWMGILASIAWLWVSVWCLVKTRWKYVWVLVLTLSVFDHFIWTQLAPWWWAIIGVTTASSIKTDLIFKKGNPVEARAEYMVRKFKEVL